MGRRGIGLAVVGDSVIDRDAIRPPEVGSDPAFMPGTTADHSRSIGIVDIGSNSTRLVVYDGRARIPMPVFNEKAICALGRRLQETGRLSVEGVEMALAAVSRFVRLADAMGVGTLHLLATAAVRDAEDGPDFVARLTAATGHDVRVLSGNEEAELAALGVICATPGADGLVMDLGGGSLELVLVNEGKLSGKSVTLPLGVLRMVDAAGNSRSKAIEHIDSYLETVPWLAQTRGRALYAVGGAWRSVARICIDQMRYPLHVLDKFTLYRRDAGELLGLISRMGAKQLEKIPSVSRRRMPHMPIAATLLDRLVQTSEAERVVFSVYGMREGQFFKSLPTGLKAEDPLLSACRYLAGRANRFPDHAEELWQWMAPLFPNETEAQKRLRMAGCLLGDIFWDEHPDYRSEQAFWRTLRLPLVGLEHADRAALALMVYYRYSGSSAFFAEVQNAHRLLDETRGVRVQAIGFALRLGHAISGGAPGFLQKSALTVDGGDLVLTVPADECVYAFAPSYVKRLDRLASHMNLEPRLRYASGEAS